MALFDKLDKITSRMTDKVNAIPFLLIPKNATPNGRSIPDPNRDEVSGKGIFDYLPVEYGIQLGVRKSYREANDLRSLQVGRDPQFSVDIRYFPDPAKQPRQGDIVRFPSKATLPDFEVASVQPDAINRIMLQLTTIGGQA